jgi:hypothetical protein
VVQSGTRSRRKANESGTAKYALGAGSQLLRAAYWANAAQNDELKGLIKRFATHEENCLLERTREDEVPVSNSRARGGQLNRYTS